MPSAELQVIYRFAAYDLDDHRCELRRAGEVVAIEPQVFSILLYLLRNRDRIVSRDDLIAGVWDGRIVSESTLSSRLTAVRHAVGDSGERQRLIRTVPRKGYRFIGAVLEGLSDEEPGNNRWAQELSLDKPSIAVLPFNNLTDDSREDRFLDGLVEDISAALSRFRHLSVITRSASLLQARNVDAKLVAVEQGARYVVHGTLRKQRTRIRIGVQLIDSRTTALLWAGRFDTRSRGTFDLQDRITASVIGAIVPTLERAEHERVRRQPIRELDAYSYVLRGVESLHQWSRNGIDEALRLFLKATEVEPDSASPYAMAAYCYIQRQSYGWLTDRPREMADGRALARRAAELGKDDALALAKAAHAISALGGEIDDGVVLADQAIRLNPHLAAAWYVSGWTTLFIGKPDLALERLERASQLSVHDRLMFKIHAATAYAHFFRGRYDEALQWAGNALRARPNYLTAMRAVGASHMMAGRAEQARQCVEEVRRLDPALRMSNLAELLPLRRTQDFTRWADALHTAGLPD
jgi:TolB-like protein/tetratricopeptide (TPR) repeat protein